MIQRLFKVSISIVVLLINLRFVDKFTISKCGLVILFTSSSSHMLKGALHPLIW